MARLLLISPATKACPTSGAIIDPGILFAERCFCDTPWHQLSIQIGFVKGATQNDYVSPIERSDKQASVSQEVNRVTTTKPFSQTVRIFYASGVKGEPPVPLLGTQCPWQSTNLPYVNLTYIEGCELC
ncbi:hypothetical protein TNCV_2798591 [Trichonephila clavipes]|nr:hypothetical protein TNCV_2798591 [Trichonephila clavipes]